MLYFFDLLGTFAFAVSGAIAGARKDMDIYGMAVLATVTAVGGGITRDLLIGRIPPGFFLDVNYLLLSLAATFLVFFAPRRFSHETKTLRFMDAIGLGVFTVIGVSAAIQYDISFYGAIMMGVLTGTGGGMIRDIFRNEVPFVLSREVYASACIAGGILYWLLAQAGAHEETNMFVSAVVVFSIRMVALMKNWNLPKP